MCFHPLTLPGARTAARNRRRPFWFAAVGMVALVLPARAQEASPQLAPEEVARKQMEALSAAGPVEARIDQCYRFASPANRTYTGPLNRFSAMVQSPEYQALLNARHFLVGRATQRQNEAHLLVTTVDAAGELTLFRFFLSKQALAPYADCWMTDAVIRLGAVKPPEKPRQPPAENPSI